MFRRSLGRLNFSTAQTTEALWVKIGQVCLAASFDLGFNEETHQRGFQRLHIHEDAVRFENAL